MAATAHRRTAPCFPLLVVGAEDQDHRHLQSILNGECDMYVAAGRHDANTAIRRHRPVVVICDDALADGDWRDLLADLTRNEGSPPLIVSSRCADDRLWAEVLNLGGYDLIEKPFTPMEVRRVVNMAARRGAGGR